LNDLPLAVKPWAIFSLMSGRPAAAHSVGNQSSNEMMSFEIVPGFTTPGQRTIMGMRKPPSQVVPFSPWNGVMAPSGHKASSAPLSVV
jgi:hypothetical protein